MGVAVRSSLGTLLCALSGRQHDALHVREAEGSEWPSDFNSHILYLTSNRAGAPAHNDHMAAIRLNYISHTHLVCSYGCKVQNIVHLDATRTYQYPTRPISKQQKVSTQSPPTRGNIPPLLTEKQLCATKN